MKTWSPQIRPVRFYQSSETLPHKGFNAPCSLRFLLLLDMTYSYRARCVGVSATLSMHYDFLFIIVVKCYV